MDIRFLGIEISRKTDILAFAAFLLSLSSIAYQIFIFFAGPEVIFARPRQVIVLLYQAPDTKERYLALISTLAYLNIGQPGKNAVIMQEDVSFLFEGKLYNYTWDQFVTSKFSPDPQEIKFDTLRTAGPFMIPAGGSEAHETLFAPRFGEDFITLKDIGQAFDKVRGPEQEELTWKLCFNVEMLKNRKNRDTESLKEECEVIIRSRDAAKITDKEIGYAVLNCEIVE